MLRLHHLWVLVHHAMPWFSFESLLITDALLLSGGTVGSSETLARRLGFTNRFRLVRILKQDGLPPLHRLSAWIKILIWLDEWEHHRVSLCRAALNEGKEPAACYRLVKR